MEKKEYAIFYDTANDAIDASENIEHLSSNFSVNLLYENYMHNIILYKKCIYIYIF